MNLLWDTYSYGTEIIWIKMIMMHKTHFYPDWRNVWKDFLLVSQENRGMPLCNDNTDKAVIKISVFSRQSLLSNHCVCTTVWILGQTDFLSQRRLCSDASSNQNGVTQHSSRSGNFPQHSRGYSPLWLSVCPETNPADYLSVTWNFVDLPVSGKSPEHSRRNRSHSAHVLLTQHP